MWLTRGRWSRRWHVVYPHGFEWRRVSRASNIVVVVEIPVIFKSGLDDRHIWWFVVVRRGGWSRAWCVSRWQRQNGPVDSREGVPVAYTDLPVLRGCSAHSSADDLNKDRRQQDYFLQLIRRDLDLGFELMNLMQSSRMSLRKTERGTVERPRGALRTKTRSEWGSEAGVTSLGKRIVVTNHNEVWRERR